MSKKPWLTYGLGDGLDVAHEEKLPQPKKLSTAIICLLMLGSLGGQRFYLGDKKGGLLWLLFLFVVQSLNMTLYTMSEMQGESKTRTTMQWALLVFVLIVIVKELLSLKGRVARYNDNLKQLEKGTG